MNVALYARVSTNDKEQNPETQLRPLREHVARLPNLVLIGAFVDRASADDLRGRRAWRRLLDLTRQRTVDLIVVWKLDRAFRSVLDGATTLQTLAACGCGLRSLQEPWIDTTTPLGEALYHITLAWAQLEKRQLTERVKAGMARARAEGKPIGRPPRTAPVSAHPQWPKVLRALQMGYLNRAEAAKKLHVRKAVLIAALPAFPKGGAVGTAPGPRATADGSGVP
jgi:DNA invertase Pin-like site-specific DNA recombinase